MDIDISLGLQSNKESNDFLRCLWANIRKEFGKIAWNLFPLKVENKIFVGYCDIGLDKALEVTLKAKIKGCLSSIIFSIPDEMSNKEQIESRLKGCITKTRHGLGQYKIWGLSCSLNKSANFGKVEGVSFSILGNKLSIKVKAYDEIDAKTMIMSLIKTICAYMSLDVMEYICVGTSANNSDTDACVEACQQHYKSIRLSDEIILYIDTFIASPFLYENNLSVLDKSVCLYAQGLRYSEMIFQHLNSFENYGELAVLYFMSALEVITLNDIKPETCKECGQQRYSIARRVVDFVYDVTKSETMKKKMKDYYAYRSKFVHTGEMLSSSDYVGTSIPLLSIREKDGIIMQLPFCIDELKDIVKRCIMSRFRNGVS
ncbi:HEPN domain-containing protein [Segatella hominis]|uniref:HEPN domain-containing protein n=1 Tax=Segatella hominis TaxID=2518605 RepID=UPI001C43B08A|nr:HEPN domain-containing protein [Segatella hominis]WOZ81455.1 HEPN domain-containing protein [Segatella hominis]